MGVTDLNKLMNGILNALVNKGTITKEEAQEIVDNAQV